MEAGRQQRQRGGIGRWLVVGLLLLVLLFGVAATVFAWLVHSGSYRQDLIDFIERRSGRSFTLSGPIEPAFFPWLGLRAQAFALGNAPGFGDRPLLAAEQASVYVRLLPLFIGKIRFDTLSIQGLELHLARDAGGRTNWEGLTQHNGTPEDGDRGLAQLSLLGLGGIQIEDAQITWDDRASDTHAALHELDLEVGAFGPGATIPVRIETRVTSKVYSGGIELAAQLLPEIEQNQLSVNSLEAQITPAAAELAPLGSIRLRLDRAMYAWQAGRLEMPAFALDSRDLTLRGRLVALLDQSWQMEGTLQNDPIDLAHWLRATGLLDLRLRDEQALQQTAVNANFFATAQRLTLDPLYLEAGGQVMHGKAQIRDWDNPLLIWSANSAKLDLDRLRPAPGASNSAEPAAVANEQPAAGKQQPGRGLPLPRMQGELRVSMLRAAELDWQNLRVDVQADGDEVRLSPVQAGFYEGRIDGRIGIRPDSGSKSLDIAGRFDDVALGPLLLAVNGKDPFTGRASGTADLQLRLGSEEPLRTLQGNGTLALREGMIRGFNLRRLVQEARARLRNEPIPDDAANEMAFTELAGSYTVQDGLLRNEDLSGKSPYLRVTGSGSADLPARTLDYRLDAVLVDTSAGQGGAELAELQGHTIPMTIRGPWKDLSFGVDLEGVLRAQAQDLIEDKREELEQRLEEKLQDKLKDWLR